MKKVCLLSVSRPWDSPHVNMFTPMPRSVTPYGRTSILVPSTTRLPAMTYQDVPISYRARQCVDRNLTDQSQLLGRPATSLVMAGCLSERLKEESVFSSGNTKEAGTPCPGWQMMDNGLGLSLTTILPLPPPHHPSEYNN